MDGNWSGGLNKRNLFNPHFLFCALICHYPHLREFHQESSPFIYGLLFSNPVKYHLKINGIYSALIIVSATAMDNNLTLGKGGAKISLGGLMVDK